ncbi:MAG: TonB-dependent receptor [Cyclobacteriaceae bacterium]|nr:TonB-dependent receptor [Cytophagales bacterium]MCZ8327735.1 TonB-dependent receptor [Cyclobacteriaceae bacterium]
MYKNVKLLLILFLITLSYTAKAQQTVSGTVKDSEGNVLPGVSVSVKGTLEGTDTDKDGKFSIQLNKENSVLIFSFIGFVKQEITITNQTQIEVVLQTDISLLNEVLIVGSRNANRTELNAPVPIDRLDVSTLRKSLPQYDVNQILTYVAPSFNSNRQSSSDGTEHIDPASLRGLGPDQTLVLINGKRRHTTSLLNYQSTFGNGSVGTDLNSIPVSAIERIEVLRDGAAAQYGSDAIAGVINIVLKKDTGKFLGTVNTGITSRGDGDLLQFNGSYGIDIGKKGGYLNLATDIYKRGKTNRTANHNLIIFDQSANGDFFAYAFADDSVASRQFDDNVIADRKLTRDDFNFRVGDAQVINGGLSFNLAVPLNEDKTREIYSFGGFNYRNGEGNGFRRLPSETNNVVLSIFPNGFQPSTISNIYDYSLVVGFKERLAQDWLLDISNTFGTNRFIYKVENTNNASLGVNSPTKFNAGGHQFRQNTFNVDVSRYFKNVASGLNLAFGSEFRYDEYSIIAGDENSWRNYGLVQNPDETFDNPTGVSGGSQSFNGFTPSSAGTNNRNNWSAYVDTEINFWNKLDVGAAIRYEDYSDFGNTLNGKLTTRLALTEQLAIRASASTGFRAPSLHQQHFSYASTNILPDNTLGQSGFFTNDSPVAKALGIPTLKEETSVNISTGVTFNANDNLTISVDAYQINVDDRIVLTGSFGVDPFGGPVPEIQALLEPFQVSTARFFTNAVNTTTRGIDVVISNTSKIGAGKLQTTLAANFNETEVDDELNIPTALVGQEDIYFSPAERSLLETNIPKQKITLGLDYSINRFQFLVRNTYFGRVTRDGFPFGIRQEHNGRTVTDVSLTYSISDKISATIGANNVFDIFPERQAYANSYFGVFQYAPVQMGSNGAFYFSRINFTF